MFAVSGYGEEEAETDHMPGKTERKLEVAKLQVKTEKQNELILKIRLREKDRKLCFIMNLITQNGAVH